MNGRLYGEAVRRYVLAGNARFTLASKASGSRFTFRVRAGEEKPGQPAIWFVSLLTGQDNEGDYRYLGFVRNGRYVHGGRKACAGPDAPSAKAFEWFWRHIEDVPPACEVFHEGRCGRCGRALTVPESVESGLGPECAGRAA